MVNRWAREQIVAAMRSYMDEETTAFDLDATLIVCSGETRDETVQTVADLLWVHYDDLKDHRIVATKAEWDYFNRILLLLESEAELQIDEVGRQWNYRQAIALFGVIAFAVIMSRVGFNSGLYAYTPFVGLLSMLLAWLGSREGSGEWDEFKAPFPSVSSMLSVRRRVAGFKRKRYPGGIARRRIRNPIVEWLMWMPAVAGWLLFSPVVLLFQAIPALKTKATVRLPDLTSPA